MKINSITAVIPIYNADKTLRNLNKNLIEVLEPISSTLEIIYVDDDSRDNSWAIITKLSAIDSRIKGIQHNKNYGQHNALLTGIRLAKNSIIVTLDDDLQNPPEEIPKMLDLLLSGYDVVYGTPDKEQHGFLRNCASKITKFTLQNSMGNQISGKVSAFRVFYTSLREGFSNYRNPYVCIDVLLTYSTNRFTSIQVKHHPRTIGVSNYTTGKLIRHALNMCTGFSIFPLQLASILGIIFTLFGIILLIYILICSLLYDNSVKGFRFLASIISIFSGAQMFSIGIIGEYLARIHMNSMGKPVSTIRQRTIFEENIKEHT